MDALTQARRTAARNVAIDLVSTVARRWQCVSGMEPTPPPLEPATPPPPDPRIRTLKIILWLFVIGVVAFLCAPLVLGVAGLEGY